MISLFVKTEHKPPLENNEKQKADPNLTIFGFMSDILDKHKNDVASTENLDRIKSEFENSLRQQFDLYQIVTTEEERETLIQGIINEFFFVKTQSPLANMAMVMLESTFMRISFKTLKNILNPAIQNIKVEIKVDTNV